MSRKRKKNKINCVPCCLFGVRLTAHIAIRDIVYTAAVQVLIMVMIPANKALIIPAMYGFLVVL